MIKYAVFHVVEIKIFFARQPWWADIYKIFANFFLWILHIVGCIFIRLSKEVKILKIYPTTITRISQNL